MHFVLFLIFFAAIGCHGAAYGPTNLTCAWACDNPTCESECKPVCAAPVCENSCTAPDTCQFPPQCSVNCPATFDPMQPLTECPTCETTCSAPPAQCGNCTVQCESTNCTWDCRSRQPCPSPVCELQCQAATCAFALANALIVPFGLMAGSILFVMTFL